MQLPMRISTRSFHRWGAWKILKRLTRKLMLHSHLAMQIPELHMRVQRKNAGVYTVTVQIKSLEVYVVVLRVT
jgi:hypothetical protein